MTSMNVERDFYIFGFWNAKKLKIYSAFMEKIQ